MFSAMRLIPKTHIRSHSSISGWNDWPQDMTESCALTQEKTYVIYSSFGSFFIPLIIMSIVYAKIFMATRRRLREKAKLATHVSVKVKRPVIPSSSGDGEPHASTSSDNAVTDCNHTGIGNNNSSSVMRSEYTVENSDSSQESESCVTDYSRSTSAITSSSRNCVNEHDLESNSNAICETNFSVVKKGKRALLCHLHGPLIIHIAARSKSDVAEARECARQEWTPSQKERQGQLVEEEKWSPRTDESSEASEYRRASVSRPHLIFFLSPSSSRECTHLFS